MRPTTSSRNNNDAHPLWLHRRVHLHPSGSAAAARPPIPRWCCRRSLPRRRAQARPRPRDGVCLWFASAAESDEGVMRGRKGRSGLDLGEPTVGREMKETGGPAVSQGGGGGVGGGVVRAYHIQASPRSRRRRLNDQTPIAKWSVSTQRPPASVAAGVRTGVTGCWMVVGGALHSIAPLPLSSARRVAWPVRHACVVCGIRGVRPGPKDCGERKGVMQAQPRRRIVMILHADCSTDPRVDRIHNSIQSKPNARGERPRATPNVGQGAGGIMHPQCEGGQVASIARPAPLLDSAARCSLERPRLGLTMRDGGRLPGVVVGYSRFPRPRACLCPLWSMACDRRTAFTTASTPPSHNQHTCHATHRDPGRRGGKGLQREPRRPTRILLLLLGR